MGKWARGTGMMILWLLVFAYGRDGARPSIRINAWAQTKEPAPPPQEKEGKTSDIKRTPFKPGPLILFTVPTQKGMAKDPDAKHENRAIYESAEGDEAFDYLMELQNETPTAVQAVTNLAILKKLQHMTQVNRLWMTVGPVLQKNDPAGFEAVVRCLSEGTEIMENGAQKTITPSHPEIDRICLDQYQAGAKAFVADKTGLSDTSIMEQIFGGVTLAFARTYLGDAKLDSVSVGGKNEARVVQDFASATNTFPDSSYYQSLSDRRDGALAAAVETALGASCEKQPALPLTWDSHFPSQGIDVPGFVFQEAHRDSKTCKALQVALAGEAAKREAGFVLAQIVLAQADMSLHPLARDQLAWWRGSLEGRLQKWEEAEVRAGTQFEDVVRSIRDTRAARLRLLLNAAQNPPVP